MTGALDSVKCVALRRKLAQPRCRRELCQGLRWLDGQSVVKYVCHHAQE